jgi:nuclear pore complex protein Nup62
MNSWKEDLEERVRSFTEHAHAVSAWDRALIENGDRVAALRTHVQQVEVAQNLLKATLDKIKIDEDELDAMVTQLEADVLKSSPGKVSLDIGRAETYNRAMTLSCDLSNLSSSVSDTIARLNEAAAASDRTNDEDADPMRAIVKILNMHMGTLKRIDESVTMLDQKVSELSRS